MAYAIGFMLPMIAIIVGGVWLFTSISDNSTNDRNIQRMIDENASISKEYFNRKYGEGTIR